MRHTHFLMVKLGVVIGKAGRGSNLNALIEACKSGQLPAEVSVVVSPVEESPALQRAAEHGVATQVVPYGDQYGDRLVGALYGADIICLAGFMRLLPSQVIERWPETVLNIHPSLLPKFGGKGMYGSKVHEAVIASQEIESGCTVHLVTEKYDDGAIIVQKRCAVLESDTPESLASRVLALEHAAYPEAVRRLIDGKTRSQTA